LKTDVWIATLSQGKQFPWFRLCLENVNSQFAAPSKWSSFVVNDATYNQLVLDPFRPVIESAPNAMLMVDEDGQILLVNSEVEKLFGYVQDALVGQSIDILVPPRVRGEHSEHRSSFFSEPSARAMGAGRDLYAVRKDGTEVSVEIGLTPVKTEAGTFVLSTIVDITERKRIENRIRLVVEAAPNAMVMIDGEGKIVLVNSQTEKIFGYDREELIDQQVEILVPERFRGAHPGHRDRFFGKPSARSMGAGRDLFAARKDGTEFPVEIGLSPVETDEGVLVLSAIVDITERKQAEQALREGEANLRMALEQLESQASELREANESLGQYAYVVSHDIRAPLRAIRNYADFLCEDLQTTLEQEQEEYLDGLAEAVDQAEQLVEDLLSLSRVERRASAAEPIELGVLLAELIQMLQLPDEVEITIGTDWPTISADATLVRQIFQNLILNGVKFNESSPRRIELTCSDVDAQRCQIQVRDNGIGIEPRHHEQIFRVFQRLHDSEEYEGTGIGLAIVKKAVSKLGGSLDLKSVPGEGTTFIIQLPTVLAGSQS
jgi:PAS domain S-box-containing protein